MQKAILCVLILIALILAPWLLVPIIALVAALVAAYGTLMIFALGLLVVAGIALLFVRKPKTLEDSLRERNKEFNRKYMEQAKKESPEREEGEVAAKGQAEKLVATEKELTNEPTSRSPRMIKCPHCAESISKYGLWCPKCGKDPKLIRKPTI
jgi:uncharacterized protein (DUF58 family)